MQMLRKFIHFADIPYFFQEWTCSFARLFRDLPDFRQKSCTLLVFWDITGTVVEKVRENMHDYIPNNQQRQ